MERLAIPLPNEVELSLIDSLYEGLSKKCYLITRSELLKIPGVSTFERINFYLFRKYTVTITAGLDAFEELASNELKDMCRSIINY